MSGACQKWRLVARSPFPELTGDRAEALYDVGSSEIPGKPGTIIRVWPLLSGGPGDSDAFRFLYRSTGLKGETIPVSGAIFIPSGAAPAGGRNVIAWAHPTSGWNKNRAGYGDRFSLQSGRAIQKSKGVAVIGAATQERPDPNDRSRLPGDFEDPHSKVLRRGLLRSSGKRRSRPVAANFDKRLTSSI